MFATSVKGGAIWRTLTKVNTDLAESNSSLPPGVRLIVICGLAACTPGSAPGPAFGN